MKKCLLVINKRSGNAERALNNPDIFNTLKQSYDIIDTLYIEESQPVNIASAVKGYQALAVCGGDGTFNNAINATREQNLELTYIPCGTLNETAKTLHLTDTLRPDRRQIRRVDLGEINNKLFSYVAAAGTFTAIGYRTRNSFKKRFKFLAYLVEVLKEYRVHHIKAKITLDGKEYSDAYTLIMAINSQRCFGFNFNHLYSHNSGTAHLLLIKAPKGSGLFALIKIFFPFFRAFFMGLKKQYDGKNLKFIEFKTASISLEDPETFTIDGERLFAKGEFFIKIHKQKINLFVY
ncbi:MAG: diacylglycerol kinase family protein [Clostridia bacterium]|nr:diacylglycerol kinase family protein [Clostridia bacterium]